MLYLSCNVYFYLPYLLNVDLVLVVYRKELKKNMVERDSVGFHIEILILSCLIFICLIRQV